MISVFITLAWQYLNLKVNIFWLCLNLHGRLHATIQDSKENENICKLLRAFTDDGNGNDWNNCLHHPRQTQRRNKNEFKECDILQHDRLLNGNLSFNLLYRYKQVSEPIWKISHVSFSFIFIKNVKNRWLISNVLIIINVHKVADNWSR